MQRPALVVEIEHGRNGAKIDVRLVVGVDGPHVAPVRGLFLVFVAKVVSEHAVLADDARKNVLAEIVSGSGILGVVDKNGNEKLRIEDVDAHRGVHLAGVKRESASDSPAFPRSR